MIAWLWLGFRNELTHRIKITVMPFVPAALMYCSLN